jgi:hypothetical protein
MEERNQSISPIIDMDAADVLGLRGGFGTDIGMAVMPAPQPRPSKPGAPPPEGNVRGEPPPPPGSPSNSRRGSHGGRQSRSIIRGPERTLTESRLKLSDLAKYQGKANEDYNEW